MKSTFSNSLLTTSGPRGPARGARDRGQIDEVFDRLAAQAGEHIRFAIAETYYGMWQWNRALPHLRRAHELNREYVPSRLR